MNDLNPEQLAAVRHGIGDEAHDTRPLLVIAGAGSGKTNTLACRVAELIARGADPRRILLLTFSRRAAAEMGRRVEWMVASMPGLGGAAGAALAWSGTFHAIGARLIRDYADR
ncbi:MAG TPA: UvrD-helicase domain-containing protein, partial [Ramlibacter sp.]|nr:UvrD-helicase domain-containing protein [Ramlibacter sp.]